MLAYHFPPIGGAGAQRSVKMARYLPDHGWRPVVLTGPGGDGGRWTPADGSLAGELPADLEVHRTAGPVPAGDPGWRRRAGRWLRLPNAFARWWVPALIEAARGVDSPVEAVYASMAPYESAVAAARIAAERGIPWVADLRDPWALDEMAVYPSRLHRSGERDRMRYVLERADAVVMNTAEAAARVRREIPAVAGNRLEVIPNGFDAADFAGPAPVRDDGRFRIVHTGYLHTELGRDNDRRARAARVLGGGAAEVDILTRSHVHLVEAINRLAADRPDLTERLELHLAGVLSDADRRVAEGCAARVVMPGYVDHDRSVALLRSADLLFLPMHEPAGGRPAGIVPGKTYEYLASGRPILAAVPPGDARDLLQAAGSAIICAPSDVDGLRAGLERALTATASGDTGWMPGTDPAVIAPYERRHLAGRLAGVLDSVVTAA